MYLSLPVGEFLESAEHVFRTHELLPVLDGLVDGLVDQRLQVGPAPVLAPPHDLPHGLLAHVVQLPHLLAQQLLEDAPALGGVGEGDEDLEVEPAGPEDGVVDEVDAVGGGDDEDLLVGVEAVHLAEELVDGGGGLVGIPEVVEATAQRVDLVHEDDAAVLAAARTREQLPDALRTHPHEHLLELAGHHLDEAAARLVGQRPRQQRLASARRAVEHDAPPDPGPHLLVPLGVVEEVDHLPELLLDVLAPVVVVEAGAAPVDAGLVLHLGDAGLVEFADHVLEGAHGDEAGAGHCHDLVVDELLLVLEADVLGHEQVVDALDGDVADDGLVPVRGMRTEVDAVAVDQDVVHLARLHCLQEARHLHQALVVVQVPVQEVPRCQETEGCQQFLLVGLQGGLYSRQHNYNITMNSIIVLAFVLMGVTALDNGLALTPPLALVLADCNGDEVAVIRQADLLLSSGLAAKGYKYVLVGPYWQGERDKTGRIKENASKFPSGIQDLVAQIHSKGLLLGLTTDVGVKTACGGVGSAGYEQVDAAAYASWGVDYVRIENSQGVVGARPRMSLLSNFIVETGRRIMIELDNQGQEGVEGWAGKIANTWTTTRPLQATWESMVAALNRQIGLERYAGSGAWNIAGPLLTELSLPEFTSQYCSWICLKSPLSLPPLQALPQEKLKLLLNPELLALHQDSLRQAGRLVLREDFAKGWQEVWGVGLSGNRFLVVFLNGMAQPSSMRVSLSRDLRLSAPSYWVRDPLRQSTSGSSSSDLLVVEGVGARGAEARVINV